MKPALVFGSAVSLIFIACSAQSQPPNPQKLTRPAALATLNKYIDMPEVLGKDVTVKLLLCVRHDARRGMAFDRDYVDFLAKLVNLGMLRGDRSKGIPESQYGPGFACFTPTNSAWKTYQVSPGQLWYAEFIAINQSFGEVTGIQETDPSHAMVNVIVKKKPTPAFLSMSQAYAQILQQPGEHMDAYNFFQRAGFYIFPIADQQKSYPFTKYDDGWRLGY